MNIELAGKTYETPDSFEVNIRQGEETKTLRLRKGRKAYYAEVYGNGKNIKLNKLVSAAIGKAVELTVTSDKLGIVAESDDIEVVITEAKEKKAKKKTVQVDKVELEATTEDPKSE